jgi:hypothetical protein
MLYTYSASENHEMSQMYSDVEFLYDKASGTSELQSFYRQGQKMTSWQGSLRLLECQGEDKTRPLGRKCNNLTF